MARNDLNERLGMLGFPVLEREPVEVANVTLADVVKSDDIRLEEAFPVMLAKSIEKQWFNYKAVQKSVSTSNQKSRLNSLIAMSLALYDVLDLRSAAIQEFRKYFETTKTREMVTRLSEQLRGNRDFVLSGRRMSGERIKTAFSHYYKEAETQFNDLLSEERQHDLQYALSQIFSSRQKELIMKRWRGEKLTKTEREYFSRTVKKKLVALANQELNRMAQKLLT
jgi:hypothetical protein